MGEEICYYDPQPEEVEEYVEPIQAFLMSSSSVTPLTDEEKMEFALEGLSNLVSIYAEGYALKYGYNLLRTQNGKLSKLLPAMRETKAITAELKSSGTIQASIPKMSRVRALGLTTDESLDLLRIDQSLNGRVLGLGDDGLKRFSDDFLDEVFRKAVSDEPKLFDSWKILDEAGEVSIRKDIV